MIVHKKQKWGEVEYIFRSMIEVRQFLEHDKYKILTRLPSRQPLIWQQTRKLIERPHQLCVTHPNDILVYSNLNI